MPADDMDLDLAIDATGVDPDSLFSDGDTAANVAAPAAEKSEAARDEGVLMNPLTGALVDLNNIDSVIAACDEVKAELDDLRCFERTLRERAAAFTSGEAKTRRIQGQKYRAKIEMPDISWDQAVLREAYNSYPQFRDDYLKIGTIDVRLREYKKLASLTTDDPAFGQFKSMLDAANRGPQGLPRVSVEK